MKNKMLIVAILSLFTFSLFGQNEKDQMMLVSFTKVTPANADAYVKATEDFISMLKTAGVNDVLWYGNFMDDYTFAYAVPIDNMAQLDKPFWAEAVKKVGLEKFKAAISEMESLMVESKNEIYIYNDGISYVHPSIAKEQNTYRVWTIFQFKPGSSEKVAELAKEWKELYVSKGIVANYQMYLGILGSNNETLVSLDYAKDAEELARRNAKAQEAFGEEGQKLWEKTVKLIVSHEVITGAYLPNLSYFPAPEKVEKEDVMVKEKE